MPSSLMIVALAAAWLVILVPMVARKRQEVSHTGAEALEARIVRSGNACHGERKESTMSESAERTYGRATAVGDDTDATESRYMWEAGLTEMHETEMHETEMDDERRDVARDDHGSRDADRDDAAEDRPAGRYRPGRGGFDPEAAEMAARAKYATRQRMVLALLATVLLTALFAGFVLTALWWANGAAIAALVGYLGYLRRQVRIENEIRKRRMARVNGEHVGAGGPRAFTVDDDRYPNDRTEEPTPLYPAQHRSRPFARSAGRDAEVLDIDDEDPAFHDLDEPSYPAYRTAVGE